MEMTSRHLAWPILACLALGLLVGPHLGRGAQDLRMLGVTSLDEAAFAGLVKRMLTEGSLDPAAFTYGALYPYVGLSIVAAKGLIAPVSDTDIILALRLVSLLAGVASLLLTYRIGRDVYHPSAGAMASVLLASSPLFLKWCGEIHPDILQLSLMLGSLSAACRLAQCFRQRELFISAACAGLAFGTKYGGVFLIPVLAVAVPLGLRESPSVRGVVTQFRRAATWRWILLALAAFSVAFVATNPWAIVHWRGFADALGLVGRIVSEGDSSRGIWFRSLFSHSVGVGLAAAGTAFTIYSVLRGYRTTIASGGQFCLILWVLSYLLYLSAIVRFGAIHYLVPVLPAMAILAVSGITSLTRLARLPAAAGAGLVLAISVFQGVQARRALGRWELGPDTAAVLEAGRWLKERYPPDTTILHDAYSYVPSEFQAVQSVFGQSYPLILLAGPDVLVTRKSVEGRYDDLGDTSHFRLASDRSQSADFLYLESQQFRDIHFTYAYLRQGLLPEYQLVRDFDHVRVYEYVGPDRGDARKRRDTWNEALWAYQHKAFTSLAAGHAFVLFGDIHRSVGAWDRAETQYRKAIGGAPDYNLPHYRLGLVLVHKDSIAAAERAFSRAAALTQPPAALYDQLGWDLYEMEEFEQSRTASLRAHRMAPDRILPLFNVALTYLVEGHAPMADSLYGVAAGMYGFPTETAALLERLVGGPDLTDACRRVALKMLQRVGGSQEK